MNAQKPNAEILIAEDSPTQAEQLKHILERNGYTVTLAQNGREALARLRQRQPAMVITDIVMPEMDGYQLCREIRTNHEFKDVPVILLSSLSAAEDVVRGLECGADNFITKPYDEAYLLSRIQYIFANWHLRDVDRTRTGLEVFFSGRKHLITSDRMQILNLLLSTYETAVQRNDALVTAQEELRKVNEQLEERTIQLEQANKDLEAFSYSVSHDLRAPLRAIAGFSRVLKESCTGQLNEAGTESLQRISDGVKEMNLLIEDVLKLFGVTGGKIERQKVNLSQIAVSILEELRRAEPDRKVQAAIQPDLIVEGDASLLRIALQNILNNAWKFTAKKPEAHIEFGGEQKSDRRIFFVRDNGAGFEMAYATRLFDPFRRLHSESEFEGTGIGLATVKRIIQRHGGRVWAEAKPNQGATFFFALP